MWKNRKNILSAVILQIIWLYGFRSYYSASWSIDESHGLMHLCSIVFQDQIRTRGVVWQGFWKIYTNGTHMALALSNVLHDVLVMNSCSCGSSCTFPQCLRPTTPTRSLAGTMLSWSRTIFWGCNFWHCEQRLVVVCQCLPFNLTEDCVERGPCLRKRRKRRRQPHLVHDAMHWGLVYRHAGRGLRLDVRLEIYEFSDSLRIVALL